MQAARPVGMTRWAAAFVICAACAAEEAPPVDPGPSLFDQAWPESIRAGDMIVVVPGTGTHTGVGALIDAAPTADFVARDHITTVDPIEAANAAAQRAGFSGADLEAGAVRFGMWGAGIENTAAFTYVSVEGFRIHFEVVGGKSVCADGGIPDNLLNYNTGNAELDARDLYQHLQTWVGAGADRNITLVSHSWGGVVAEYFAQHAATLEHDYGALTGARVVFAAAAGVPGFVPGGFVPAGPGFRTVESGIKLYEIDRPDDPAHTFDPSRGGDGHHYVILVGTQYLGWYGITTDALACAGVAGACPTR